MLLPKVFEHRRRVERRPYIPNHPPMVGHIGPQYPRFQIRIVLEHDGKRCETDVPLMGLDIARLGLEAGAQNLTITQLLTQAVTTAIKRNLIERIYVSPLPQAHLRTRMGVKNRPSNDDRLGTDCRLGALFGCSGRELGQPGMVHQAHLRAMYEPRQGPPRCWGPLPFQRPRQNAPP